MSKPISIPDTFASFTEAWSPRLVASVNDHHVKIARLDGEFIMHAHPNSDELFYLLSGELTMEIDGEEAVKMRPGDVYVVSKGTRHKPVAANAMVMMLEKEGTVNTGDTPVSDRTKEPEDVRPEP